MFVIEALPLAEIFLLAISANSMGNYSVNVAITFEIFPLTFLVQQKRFCVFAGKIWSGQSRLPLFVSLDIVVDTLKAFKTLEKFIGFVCVVEVGEGFPFDVEALFDLFSEEDGKDE